MRIFQVFFTILACSALLASGCMDASSESRVSPTPSLPTTSPTVAPSRPMQTPTLSLVPEPTDVMPYTYSVAVQVIKNTIATDPSITVTFEGGQGLAFVEFMTAEVIRSDGKVDEHAVESPQMGTEIVLSGTTGTDRVIVSVTMDNGVTYKVFDRDMPFQPINPQY